MAYDLFYRVPPRLEAVLKASYESMTVTFTIGGDKPGEKWGLSNHVSSDMGLQQPNEQQLKDARSLERERKRERPPI